VEKATASRPTQPGWGGELTVIQETNEPELRFEERRRGFEDIAALA
jgi:hypothetical protein